MLEEVARKITVFQEEENRPLPVMARASKREMRGEEVMVMQVIPDRLEEETLEEEKIVHLTDHIANPMIVVHGLFRKQITLENLNQIQEKDHFMDELKDPQVGQ